MIIGLDLLLDIELDLNLYNYTIEGSGGAYKGFTDPMKSSCDLCDDARFINEELW